MDGYSFKRILRRPWLSLAGFVVGGVMCFLLCFLASYKAGQQEYLNGIRQKYEIVCVITDQRGTRSDGLGLASRYEAFVRDEEKGLGSFVKEIRLVKTFDGSSTFGSFKLLGVTNEHCDEQLDPAMGGGYHSETENFFESSERICLVSMEDYNTLAGQEVSLSVVDAFGASMGGELGRGSFTFRVVGWFSGAPGTVFIPYATAQDIAARVSHAASLDSLSFVLKDNDSVEALYEAAYPMFVRVDPSAEDNKYALTVQDKQYNATVSALEQNIRRTGYLLPLLSLLGLGAGFLLGFLGTRGEMRSYALQRTLGLTPVKLALSILFEQQTLTLLACICAGAVTKQPATAAIYFGCSLIGCAAAVIKAVSVPPTELLRDQE